MSVLVLSLVLTIVCAPVASAQDGVQVDPDSPPAVEYALPLAEARADNAPSPDAGAGDAAAGGAGQDERPATFGSGITPRQAGARPGSPGGAGSKPGRDDGDGSSSGSGTGGAAAPSTGARAGDVGGRATLYSVGAAAAILLVGGLVGLALRRRQPSA